MQMVRSAEQYLKRKEYREEWVEYETTYQKHWYDRPVKIAQRKRMDGRTARRNFYEGFRIRSVSVLDARKEAIAQADPFEMADGQTESAALVLKRRVDEVEDFYQSKIAHKTGSWQGGSRARYSKSANQAGRSAGSSARTVAEPASVESEDQSMHEMELGEAVNEVSDRFNKVLSN